MNVVSPHPDLASMDQIALVLERDRIRGIANERYRSQMKSDLPQNEPFVRHLTDDECEYLVALINELRRRTGGQPRAASGSKSKKKTASDADLLSM